MIRYMRQSPDLPTIDCETCWSYWHTEPDGSQFTYVAVDGSERRCDRCNGTGQVSPFSPHIGDVIEWDYYKDDAEQWRIIEVAENGRLTLHADHFGTRWPGDTRGHNLEHLTLVRPSLDTPERQALAQQIGYTP